MTDEIEQLLRNLHLKKIAAIIEDEAKLKLAGLDPEAGPRLAGAGAPTRDACGAHPQDRRCHRPAGG